MKEKKLDQGREEGLRRYRIIVPLLDESLAECEKRQIRRLICTQEGISERSLRRYVANYKHQGFDGLMLRERKDKGSSQVHSGGSFKAGSPVTAGSAGA